MGSLPASLTCVLGIGHDGLGLKEEWRATFQGKGVVVHAQHHVGVIGKEGREVVPVLSRIEEDVAVVQPLKLDVAVVDQHHGRVVIGIEHRARALDLHAALEHGRANRFVDGELQRTLDALFKVKIVLGPAAAVHELPNGVL